MSEPPSPRQFRDGEDVVGDLASHITSLREEIRRLRQQLAQSEADCECEKRKKSVYLDRVSKSKVIIASFI